MDKIKEKKEELKQLIQAVTGKERDAILSMMQDLLQSCSPKKTGKKRGRSEKGAGDASTTLEETPAKRGRPPGKKNTPNKTQTSPIRKVDNTPGRKKKTTAALGKPTTSKRGRKKKCIMVSSSSSSDEEELVVKTDDGDCETITVNVSVQEVGPEVATPSTVGGRQPRSCRSIYRVVKEEKEEVETEKRVKDVKRDRVRKETTKDDKGKGAKKKKNKEVTADVEIPKEMNVKHVEHTEKIAEDSFSEAGESDKEEDQLAKGDGEQDDEESKKMTKDETPAKVVGTRKRGRPRKYTWEDLQVNEDMEDDDDGEFEIKKKKSKDDDGEFEIKKKKSKDDDGDNDEDFIVKKKKIRGDGEFGVKKRKSAGYPMTSKPVANLECLKMFRKCFLCADEEASYDNEQEFEAHLKAVHLEQNEKGKDVISCPRCIGKSYLVRVGSQSDSFLRNIVDVLIHYVRKHSDYIVDFATEYTCPKCLFSSIDKQAWIEHIQEHLNKSVQCEKCSKMIRVNSFFTHMKNMHSEEPKQQFPCEQCGKSFASIIQVKYHVDRIHLRTKHFRCFICDAEFYYKFDLERHMFVWHKQQIENKPIAKCEICGFETLKGNLMNKHMTNHQKGSFPCKECNKVFETKNRLRSHMSIHSTSSVFKCELCDYEGKKKYHLERHMTYSHGGQVYQCEHCEFHGTSDRGILQHYNRAHGKSVNDVKEFRKVQIKDKAHRLRHSHKRPKAYNNIDTETQNSEEAPMTVAYLVTDDTTDSSHALQKAVPDTVEHVVKMEQDAEMCGIQEVTCVLTEDTNPDGTPVVLSVQGDDNLPPSMADLQFVQNVLQLNPAALKAATVETDENGDSVTVYHIMQPADIPADGVLQQ